jgi:hypothetical protein
VDPKDADDISKRRKRGGPVVKAPLGSGARFAALKSKIAAHGGVRDPGAAAATIGRRKYGRKRFAALGAAGKK